MVKMKKTVLTSTVEDLVWEKNDIYALARCQRRGGKMSRKAKEGGEGRYVYLSGPDMYVLEKKVKESALPLIHCWSLCMRQFKRSC